MGKALGKITRVGWLLNGQHGLTQTPDSPPSSSPPVPLSTGLRKSSSRCIPFLEIRKLWAKYRWREGQAARRAVHSSVFKQLLRGSTFRVAGRDEDTCSWEQTGARKPGPREPGARSGKLSTGQGWERRQGMGSGRKRPRCLRISEKGAGPGEGLLWAAKGWKRDRRPEAGAGGGGRSPGAGVRTPPAARAPRGGKPNTSFFSLLQCLHSI